MYWTEQQYLDHHEEKRERIIVTCAENDCDGTFELIRYSDDFSPRVHDNCSKCNRFMSVKLSYIDDERIISREWI